MGIAALLGQKRCQDQLGAQKAKEFTFKFPRWLQNLPASVGDVRDVGSMPRSGRSLVRGHGNPVQYSGLENPTEEPGGLQSTGSHRVMLSLT